MRAAIYGGPGDFLVERPHIRAATTTSHPVIVTYYYLVLIIRYY